jgi:hypothetical protein
MWSFCESFDSTLVEAAFNSGQSESNNTLFQRT